MERFNYVKKGYDPMEVEEYIRNLEAVIKGYKEKDAAIKNAIVSAQFAADEIVRKAQAAEEDIIRNARNQSAEIASKSSAHVQSILNTVKHQKDLYRNFTFEYNAVVSKYLQQVNEKDFDDINERFLALERYMLSFNPDPVEEEEDDDFDDLPEASVPLASYAPPVNTYTMPETHIPLPTPPLPPHTPPTPPMPSPPQPPTYDPYA